MEDERVKVTFYHKDFEDDNCSFKPICYFFTEKFAEWLKFFNYAKKHEIEFYPHEFDEKMVPGFYESTAGIGALVDGVCVVFGSDDVIKGIEVYLQ